MKAFFRRREHEVPALNTSSLPDLIFTVLFFFMIVTHMREVELKVRYEVPQGTQLEKLVRKSAVTYIYIGMPAGSHSSVASQHPADYRIQLNDKLATLDEIQDFIAAERNRMSSEDINRMTVSIKADRHVPMGIIADVKQRLQQSHALKINYSATQK